MSEVQDLIEYTSSGKLKAAHYNRELAKLQQELVKLHYWIKEQGLKVCVIFEGRDAAGKGGVIKRITQRLNPRIARVVALATPSDREKQQWYFQRYVPHLPSAGEMVLFDRSWYNRAGVERVMGFCTDDEYRDFMRTCPEFELEYSRAKDAMFMYTDTEKAPWFVVDANIKRHARLNCISHFLSLIDYKDLTPDPIKLPPRQQDTGYKRPPITSQKWVPAIYGENAYVES